MSYTTFALSLPDDQVAFLMQQAAMRGVTVSDVLATIINIAMRSIAHQQRQDGGEGK